MIHSVHWLLTDGHVSGTAGSKLAVHSNMVRCCQRGLQHATVWETIDLHTTARQPTAGLCPACKPATADHSLPRETPNNGLHKNNQGFKHTSMTATLNNVQPHSTMQFHQNKCHCNQHPLHAAFCAGTQHLCCHYFGRCALACNCITCSYRSVQQYYCLVSTHNGQRAQWGQSTY
jgi:hypothetical protein